MEKEEWKTIEGYENYQVSSMGRVKSLNYNRTRKEKMLKPKKDKDGYYQISLSKDAKPKTYFVHRLVASHFIPNPNNYPCVNHKNEIKIDNNVSNLEWCTIAYNINYGTRNKRTGKANSIALKGKKQSQEHIKKKVKAQQKPILQLSKSGNNILYTWNSATQASKELGINRENIYNCCKGKQKTAGKYKWMYLQDYINKMNRYLTY